jgi:hypothetical protein
VAVLFVKSDKRALCVVFVVTFPPLVSFFYIPVMAGQRLFGLIVAQVLFAGLALFLANSPYLNMSVAPTKQPWADGPMKLVTTPQYETKKVSNCD